MSSAVSPSLQLLGTFVRQSNLQTTLLPTEAPKADIEYKINLNAAHRALADANHFAVSLTLTLEGQLAGQDLPTITGVFEVEMVASIENMPEASKDEALSTFIPNQIMPYLRELVHSATTRAGFNSVTLPPIVFGINPEDPVPSAPGQRHVPAPTALLH